MPNLVWMQTSIREMPELELALLRRGVDERSADSERCGQCGRTPLVGEHVYVYERGALVCELCRSRQREAPLHTRTVHGSEFGHSIRLLDRRAA